jgi:electron transport complex protein RnfB
MRRVNGSLTSLADRIDALLPQTQCTRCGFAACRPYADAVATGSADLNRCPPGGDRVIVALAPECGENAPLKVAVIDEATCIGCTLCIEACPVDAIVGAQKRMHAVLPSLCSGCALCVAPCPVDCIALRPAGRDWSDADAGAARGRFAHRAARMARNERVARRTVSGEVATADPDRARRQATVAAALARARARRAAGTSPKS